MRVLLLGAGGMLGHKLHETLATQFEVTSTVRRPLASLPVDASPFFAKGTVVEGIDATSPQLVRQLAEEIRPDVVINCVGVIKQREAAKDPIPSIEVNALLPHRLARLSTELGARFIHFSTDCIFSGRNGNYSESDVSDAADLYGRTKYLGEVATERALTIRTSIIGRELDHFASLLEWFLHQRGSVSGYSHAIFSGLTTLELARVVHEVINEHTDLVGLYQVASNPVSKYELLNRLRDGFGLKDEIEIVPDASVQIDRSLRGDRFVKATGIRTPSWNEMIEELAVDAGRYGRVT